MQVPDVREGARALLDDEAGQAAWQSGRGLSLEQAVEEARAEVSRPA